jgi:hypothetical protein
MVWGVTAALLVTLSVGLYLRWALTGMIQMRGEFADLRHAHSHLGYFGLLFPLAWLGWSRVNAPAPGRRLLAVYAAATVVAFLGFLRAGYGPDAIVGCTVVGVIWLISAWPLRRQLTDLYNPLGVVPFGVVAGLACIPPIAFFLRRDPALAHRFVATFLAMLLLAVIVPSALASRRISAGPWPVLGVAAGLGAVALGVWPDPIARAGLLVFALLIVWGVARSRGPIHLKVGWGTVGLGLACIALGVLTNNRVTAIGAIHFLILAPVLSTLAPGLLRRPVPSWAWFLEYAFAGVLGGSLVAQGAGAGAWTLTASALGGTAVVLWWIIVLIAQQRRSGNR